MGASSSSTPSLAATPSDNAQKMNQNSQQARDYDNDFNPRAPPKVPEVAVIACLVVR